MPDILGEISHSVDFHYSVALFPEHGLTFDELFRSASTAMKYAKDSGDIMYSLFDSLMEQKLRDENDMRTYLEKAIEQGEITPWYQRKVDYTSGRTVGVEALARWTSEVLGPVSPGIFIPAVHRFYLDVAFGNYMIDRVLSDYHTIVEKYGDIKVSLNISPTYFDSSHILAKTKEALEKYKVPADRIIYEVTEDIFIGDFDGFKNMAGQLKGIGISLSLDDFGTGYSSLNYLKHMDINVIKVDKVFIDRIVEDPQAFKLLQGVCSIAELFDYEIVAEGVETEDQLAWIAKTPLKIVQGYIFSKPEPLA